jgi:ketosteroid isomerase-like protein
VGTPARPSTRDLAEGGYAAWNSGEVESFLAWTHPEIVWISSGVFPGMRPSYEGAEGMRQFWREFHEPWEKLEIEIEELHEIGTKEALMLVRFHARGRQGIEVDHQITNHLVMRDDKLWRFRAFPEWGLAIAELGIADPHAD